MRPVSDVQAVGVVGVVSIHAPWEGCDLGFAYVIPYANRFQFTHPGKGATDRYDARLVGLAVSIHAPWEGCDSSTLPSWRSLVCFNSRTLGRVRPPAIGLLRLDDAGFNSRTLGRVRQPTAWREVLRIMFQFTHPGKGATQAWKLHNPAVCSFNSRTLGRVRLRLGSFIILPSVVSIHAPWEGCDYSVYSCCLRYRVSIHAPWEGCDLYV